VAIAVVPENEKVLAPPFVLEASEYALTKIDKVRRGGRIGVLPD
jgi:hypothetical protein